MMKLKEQVFESLENSVKNGYDPLNKSVAEVAADLATYDADLEDVNYAILEYHVIEWMDSKRLQQGDR